MFKVSWFGTSIVVAPMALLVTITLCWVRRTRAAVCFVVVVVGVPLLGTIAKAVVRRPRPRVGGSPAHPHAWSYPSGHALEVAALWVALGIIVVVLTRSTWLRGFVWVLAAVVIAAVGVSRVYLGVHWTTDVLAGWTVGTVWASRRGVGVRAVRTAGGRLSPRRAPSATTGPQHPRRGGRTGAGPVCRVRVPG